MYGIQCAGRSILHLVERWKSDALLASQRLPVIHFLIHNCSANVNIQVYISCLSSAKGPSFNLHLPRVWKGMQ